MLRWHCSSDAIDKSRHSTPASVMEYILRAGPFSLVSHVLSMTPFFSICLSVLYKVPGLIASSQKAAVFRRSSTAEVTSGAVASASWWDEPIEGEGSSCAYCFPPSGTQYEARKTAFSLTTYTTLTHPKDQEQATSIHRIAWKAHILGNPAYLTREGW